MSLYKNNFLFPRLTEVLPRITSRPWSIYPSNRVLHVLLTIYYDASDHPCFKKGRRRTARRAMRRRQHAKTSGKGPARECERPDSSRFDGQIDHERELIPKMPAKTAQWPAPAVMLTACSNWSAIPSQHSRAAFVDPGKLTTSVPPRCMQTARESIARLVLVME